MDKEFIDRFKQEGSLRICLMAKYQMINDIRQDETEGLQISKLTGHGELTGEQAKKMLGININSINFDPQWKETLTHNNKLPPAYVLCTSTSKSNQLMQRFKCNGYFTIYNITEFKKALERAISDHFEIEHSLDKHVEYKLDKGQNYDIGKLIESENTLGTVDAMSYFRKTSDYISESEYRFVYIVNSENPPSELFINLTQEEINASCTFHKTGEGTISSASKIGRNDLCHCGSNKKYKKCHGSNI